MTAQRVPSWWVYPLMQPVDEGFVLGGHEKRKNNGGQESDKECEDKGF